MNTQVQIPVANTAALTDKAMLVSLQIKVPSTSKQDKQATKEVSASHHASEGAARVNKSLFPKESTQGFAQAAREARAIFYENTLQWAAPQRILLSANYFKLMELLDRQQTIFWKESEKFLAQYDEKIVEARMELGSLFREEDYPEMEIVRSKFSFEISVNPLTNSSDWRVSLGSEAEDQIKVRMEQQLKSSYQEAAREPWERMKKVLDAMVERLSDPEARFSGTLVTNISDLCEVLPGLNIGNDPKLIEMIHEVREKLGEVSPKDLRDDPKVRKETVQAANKLSQRVDEYAGII